MKKKIGKRVLLALVCLILVGAIVWGVLIFRYYPQYRKSTASYDITTAKPSKNITMVSANVRCFSPTDILEKSWFYRADLLLKTVTANAPDIIGFQEVSAMHYKYLTNALKGYESVIQYRDTSKFAESCPIFYNTAKFKLAEQGSFWLSETPEVQSKDWDSACYRVCTYVILEQIADGKRLAVYNTHLDHYSSLARLKGIRMVMDRAEALGEDTPSVIMGDLNLNEATDIYENSIVTRFFDAKYQTMNSDHGATYQNYGKALNWQNIDYFLSSHYGIIVKSYKVLRTTFNGQYPSDHYPIQLQIEIRR